MRVQDQVYAIGYLQQWHQTYVALELNNNLLIGRADVDDVPQSAKILQIWS